MARHPVIQEGNVAVITGAADGIGLAIATRLAGLGMRVCLADIDEEKLQQSAAGIEGADLVEVDASHLMPFTDPERTAELVREACRVVAPPAPLVAPPGPSGRRRSRLR